jgi:hypothetical protein
MIGDYHKVNSPVLSGTHLTSMGGDSVYRHLPNDTRVRQDSRREFERKIKVLIVGSGYVTGWVRKEDLQKEVSK